MISKVSSTHAVGKGGLRDYTRGSTSSGVRPYRRLLPDTIERAKSTYDTIGRFLYEPYDWARIGVDCYNDDCDGWDFAGLLPLVPGGMGRAGKWLFKHEGVQRGHTILKHVSQPLSSLQARLRANSWMGAASTYTDIETAQDAISETISANRGEIQNWLRNSPNDGILRLNHNVGRNIGEVLHRGSQSTVSSSNVRVVLKRTPDGGYFILTSFPQ